MKVPATSVAKAVTIPAARNPTATRPIAVVIPAGLLPAAAAEEVAAEVGWQQSDIKMEEGMLELINDLGDDGRTLLNKYNTTTKQRDVESEGLQDALCIWLEEIATKAEQVCLTANDLFSGDLSSNGTGATGPFDALVTKEDLCSAAQQWCRQMEKEVVEIGSK